MVQPHPNINYLPPKLKNSLFTFTKRLNFNLIVLISTISSFNSRPLLHAIIYEFLFDVFWSLALHWWGISPLLISIIKDQRNLFTAGPNVLLFLLSINNYLLCLCLWTFDFEEIGQRNLQLINKLIMGYFCRSSRSHMAVNIKQQRKMCQIWENM